MADTHGGVRQSGEKRTTEIESDEEEPTPQAVCCVDPANRKLVFKGKAKASVRMGTVDTSAGRKATRSKPPTDHFY
uniref:Uncharacterized protein n=1 Tax=Oryza glumipatula TaxID=40148 RepID=A0A0E0A1B4_9ORYZ